MESKLLNQIVIHPAFGRGQIINYKDGKLRVVFGSDEKVFLYPEAFEKFLTFDDLKMQDVALSELQQKKEAERIEQEKKKKAIESFYTVQKPKKQKSTPVKKNYSGIKYKDWEEMYPNHVIIQKEGFMYSAHNESAEIIAEVLDYKLMTDIAGRITTGGPDSSKIGFALEKANHSYIIIEDEQIIDQFDAQ